MDGPVAIITGATRGIGRAIADNLAATHHLVLAGRAQGPLGALAAGYPSAEVLPADLSRVETLASTVDDALGRLDRVDALIHSAGILGPGRVDVLTPPMWQEALAVNVVAVAELTRLFLPALRRAGGTVVTINSGAGFRSGPGGGLYAATKFALRAFTDALREEERSTGVRVTSVHPGPVDTDMLRELVGTQGEAYRAERYLRPASVASAVRFALEVTDEASVDVVSIRPRSS